MHELSVAQALVDELERILLREHALEVLSVTVNIGALSGVDREAFTFAFPLAIEGTGMARALLVINETPVEITCDGCGNRSVADMTDFRCRACGSDRVRITAGRDILIQSVELRVEDQHPAAVPPETGARQDV